MEIFEECVQGVREVCGQRPMVVLPSTEYFNSFLLMHRAEIESMGCEIPLVETQIYNLLTSKRSATDFFAAAGFPVPAEPGASEPANLPLVAKPFRNISKKGRSLYPQLLTTRSELDAFVALEDTEEYFLQEYVSGESYYLFVYVPRSGDQAHTFSQRNLMQQPNGKSMLLAEPASFHLSPIATRVVELLRNAGFRGLGMVEIIKTPDRAVFIEMNPRIWGPIQLCVDRQQPLLRAFIGEALHGDPSRFVESDPQPSPRIARYFWLNGLIDTIAAGKRPTWHIPKQSILKIAFANLKNDVYLRADSWRCFVCDLMRTNKNGTPS